MKTIPWRFQKIIKTATITKTNPKRKIAPNHLWRVMVNCLKIKGIKQLRRNPVHNPKHLAPNSKPPIYHYTPEKLRDAQLKRKLIFQPPPYFRFLALIFHAVISYLKLSPSIFFLSELEELDEELSDELDEELEELELFLLAAATSNGSLVALCCQRADTWPKQWKEDALLELARNTLFLLHESNTRNKTS